MPMIYNANTVETSSTFKQYLKSDLVDNYAKYREMRDSDLRREQNREAQRRHRDKLKTSANVSTNADSKENQPQSAQAEAEEEESNPSSSPDGDGGFDRFWTAYPRKVGKGAALRAWRKLKPSAVLCGQILAAVEAQKQGQDWQREGGRFIPHPVTWLNQGRWEDEERRPVRRLVI